LSFLGLRRRAIAGLEGATVIHLQPGETSMTVRALFACNSVRYYGDPFANPNCSREYSFSPQYDMSIPEQRRFQKATPSGTFTMQVDNPAVFDRFKPGRLYYLDVEEVPEHRYTIDGKEVTVQAVQVAASTLGVQSKTGTYKQRVGAVKDGQIIPIDPNGHADLTEYSEFVSIDA
jgi:hypothetical protein